MQTFFILFSSAHFEMSKLQIRIIYVLAHSQGETLVQQLQDLAGQDIRVVAFSMQENMHVMEPHFNVDVLIKRPESDSLMDDCVDVIVYPYTAPVEIFKASRQALQHKMRKLEDLVTKAKTVLGKVHLDGMRIE